MPQPTAVAIFALGVMLAAGALAQPAPYPNKPVRLIIPYPPGGPTDLIGRAIHDGLAKRLGQPLIVDNRGGAAGVVGSEIAAQAPRDGYTLLVGTVTTLAANVALRSKLPYHPVRDYDPVALLGATPYLLSVTPSLPAKNAAQLIAYAKANPGKLSFGSAGPGSSNHLAGELFKHMAGLNMVHVPYKGSGPAMVDLMSGQIGLMFSSISSMKPHVDAGRLRALAVSTLKRASTAPDIPTLNESGLKGFEARNWNAVVAPRGTPVPVVLRLNQDINAVLASPAVANRVKDLGIETELGTPADLGKQMKEEIARFQSLVKLIGLKPE